MSNIMSIYSSDIKRAKKPMEYTVSIVECSKTGISYAFRFADAGFRVICVNTDPHSFSLLKGGHPSYLQRSQLRRLRMFIKEEILEVSANSREAVSQSDVIIIT
ncbi:MAG: hypothetical protein JSW53_02830, partial [Candidatus Bathyarchaeota archaeon]